MNIDSVVTLKPNPNIPQVFPGDTVRVSARIIEGDKERVQVFQGVVIRIRRGGAGASFTVRRLAYGVGVERTFPIYSPMIEKVEVVRHGKVRRAKLYYLRGLSGKASRIKERRAERVLIEGEPAEQPELTAEAAPPAAAEAESPVAAQVEQPVAEKTGPAPEAAPPVAEKAAPAPKMQTPAAEKAVPPEEKKA